MQEKQVPHRRFAPVRMTSPGNDFDCGLCAVCNLLSLETDFLQHK